MAVPWWAIDWMARLWPSRKYTLSAPKMTKGSVCPARVMQGSAATWAPKAMSPRLLMAGFWAKSMAGRIDEGDAARHWNKVKAGHGGVVKHVGIVEDMLEFDAETLSVLRAAVAMAG
jgi:hypothetical protein